MRCEEHNFDPATNQPQNHTSIMTAATPGARTPNKHQTEEEDDEEGGLRFVWHPPPMPPPRRRLFKQGRARAEKRAKKEGQEASE